MQLLVEGDLMMHIYYPNEAVVSGVLNTTEIVLFLPGLPQTPDKNIAERFVLEGKTFVWLHYYGSWYSGGKFSPSECRKSFLDGLSVIKKKQSVSAFSGKAFDFDYKKITVVGNSFGAQIAVTSQVDYNILSEIHLFAPFLLVNEKDADKNRQVLQYLRNTDLPFWRRGLFNVYRGIEAVDWDTYFKGEDPDSKLKKIKCHLTLCYGSNDPIISEADINKFITFNPATLKKIEGVGHDFLNLYDKK